MISWKCSDTGSVNGYILRLLIMLFHKIWVAIQKIIVVNAPCSSIYKAYFYLASYPHPHPKKGYAHIEPIMNWQYGIKAAHVILYHLIFQSFSSK